jgi:ABC-type antimicrobial peptide transport system permease subunit
VFYLRYMFSELRRRRGRTVLTAFGLAVGVALVVVVNALSSGLDDAQAQVLKPLTGVGTDLSVTRPINISRSGGSNGGPPQISAKEREQLQQENGSAQFGFRNLGKPGTKFSRDSFLATSQLSFPAPTVSKIADISGVETVAGGLTLNALHIEGKVPKEAAQQDQGGFGAPLGGQGQQSGPRSINADSLTVSGVDQSHPEVGAVTSGQIESGRYFANDDSREAILNVSYAKRKNLGVGDTITLGGKKFTVVGLAATPLGGQASDAYIKLSQLQALSDREGRVNTVYVRAESADEVDAIAAKIDSTIAGASTTTASDLADRVSGSLVDAKNLTAKLGTVLEAVGLLAAVLIASLLTLSSVSKRVRELGTLKALGWSQRLVVRQVTGEALLQGLLGAGLGVALGLLAALAVDAVGPTLKATVASATSGGGGFGPFGQGAVASAGSTVVELGAPVSLGLVGLAVALAVAGGLVAGTVGGLRAARLRPADALRHLD